MSACFAAAVRRHRRLSTPALWGSLGLVLLSLQLPPAAIADSVRRSTPEEVLDDFHRAASAADEERYLGHLSDGGVFLGTDATERWTREAFADFVHDAFSRGRGWTYRPVERHVTVSRDGTAAWFDETLVNEKYGVCRGTGALQLTDGVWRIEQYNLTIPIPNAIALDVVEEIRQLEQSGTP